MQVLIDIPEKNVPNSQEIMTVNLHFITGEVCECSYPYLVLPKGHGRLIDVGQCDRKLFYQQCGGADSLITVKSAFDMLLSLPTIIEADKAESEG